MKPLYRWPLGAAIVLLGLFIILRVPPAPSEPAAPDDAMKQLKIVQTVDPYKPTIDLSQVGLQAEQIEAVKLELEGARVSRLVEFTGNQLAIQGAIPVLELNRNYRLKLFAADGARYLVDFTTAGLPDITANSTRQVVMVPAMPEKGFHWPYFLSVPTSVNQSLNAPHKRYLMVDTTNTGSSNSVTDMLAKARTEITDRRQATMILADRLGLPLLYPAFPRPAVSYTYEGERNTFYTHALDRDTATLHLKLKDPAVSEQLAQSFRSSGFDAATMQNLDQQLIVMIDHAIAYLNQYGHTMEPQKVFLAGYSASGTFVDRFATLHPDRVKAVASGATLDDMVLPLASYQGEGLIFPIGTADFTEITGKPFDLARHNQVARLTYMGEDDKNNTLPYNDCYGDKERQLITRLFGTEVLPRAQALTKLYGESGGKGIFILDKGTQHGMSDAMDAYVKAFFEANRDSDGPVYPLPPDPLQLKYTLFK